MLKEHKYEIEDCKCGLYEGVIEDEYNDFELTVGITPEFERRCWKDGNVRYRAVWIYGGEEHCG